MCCFSREIERVADTRIFARFTGEARQALVYAMQLSAAEDLAMVLPIPTPSSSAEDALAFVDLQAYPTFFEDVESGFPRPPSRESKGPAEGLDDERQLAVVRVGAFDASFVPTQADFRRLDERFRIAPEVWAKIPVYADYGFAVFKLRRGEEQHVHPMAFTFPTRYPQKLFFPTVHIHHGAWTPRADFDHALYCQFGETDRPTGDFSTTFVESPQPAEHFVDLPKSKGLVDGARHVYRREIRGMFPNEDVTVALA